MPRISIIMRSKNDALVIKETMAMVAKQREKDFELINIDSGSEDGTLDVIREHNPNPIEIAPSEYVPGRVLNMGARKATGSILVFLNSDATPESEFWLERLIAPLDEPDVGAVYGRQISRPDTRPLFRRDNENAFPSPDAQRARSLLGNASWQNFFSMANSATRRDVWERFPFREEIQYSEDIEWANRLREGGLRVVYVPEAGAYHSHNYTLKQSWKRHFEEGRADAQIFPSGGWRENILFYAVLPYCSAVLKDAIYCLRHLHFVSIGHSIALRFAQRFARYAGMKKGRKS